MTLKVVGKIIFILAFGVMILPFFAKADNCCSAVTTISSGRGDSSTSYNCSSGADIFENNCKNEIIIGGGTISRSFLKNAKCDEQKKSCIADGTISANATKSVFEPITFTFNVPLPGLPESMVIDSTVLPKYVVWVYKFVLGMTGLLAVFMITIGAITWIFAGGNSASVNKAKQYITGSVMGILLALSSFSILYIINPQLINNEMPKLGAVEKVDLGGDTNDGISDGSLPSGIICPKSGGIDKVKEIASSFKGKMTYRLGGKGSSTGNPPYPNDSKICENGRPCKEFCPANSTCLDCSGFTNQVLRCAGLSFINSGSADIFKNAEKVESLTDTTANGKELKPGDLLGWALDDKATDSKGNVLVGHVMIYVGDGKINDSHGGDAVTGGRKAGNSLGEYNTTKYKNLIKRIKRVQ